MHPVNGVDLAGKAYMMSQMRGFDPITSAWITGRAYWWGLAGGTETKAPPFVEHIFHSWGR